MGMNSAPKPRPTMATLIFRLLMLQGSAVAGTDCKDSPEGGIKVSAVPGITQFLRATVNGKLRRKPVRPPSCDGSGNALSALTGHPDIGPRPTAPADVGRLSLLSSMPKFEPLDLGRYQPVSKEAKP